MKKIPSPENAQQIHEAAEAIKEQRRLDRSREIDLSADYSRSRGLLEYTEQLEGITHFLAYIRSLSFVRAKLLDIGAGDTRAMSQLQNSPELGYNLDIKATSLTLDKNAGKFLGRKNIILTSAEKLRGIKDGEISGIISTYSIGYSLAPELVAENLDRVLVPSGAMKLIYAEQLEKETEEDTKLELAHQKLINELKKRKYDISIKEREGLSISGKKLKAVTLLAIKPPVVGITAKKLHALDSADEKKQIEALQSAGFEPIKNELMPKHINRALRDPLIEEEVDSLLNEMDND